VSLAAVRLAALGLALVLAISVAFARLFVGGPPSVAELRAQAGVESWPELRIGVKDDQYGTAFHDVDNDTWSGFDIDIAYMIAEDLGFRRSEVRFYGMESEDRARMQATDGERRVPVHMVIASFSITPGREAMAGVTFSAPYLYTEQSVLTLAGREKISSLEDLRGQKVCTLSTATSETAPEKAEAIVSRKNRIGECIEDLRAGRVDVVTTDAAILGGYQARFPDEFAHSDLGLDATEAWGVNVGENPALKTLVDLTLYRSLKDPRDDRWEEAYERNLQSEVRFSPGTPIAQAQQPDVPKPDVREQPWEEVF
jgi:glutamate transport system substrate-binding protein